MCNRRQKKLYVVQESNTGRKIKISKSKFDYIKVLDYSMNFMNHIDYSMNFSGHISELCDISKKVRILMCLRNLIPCSVTKLRDIFNMSRNFVTVFFLVL